MDQLLIDDASRALEVRNLVRLREGGQKYVARCDTADGEVVVLKVVALQGVGNADEQLERARREVGLLADMDHPNIVRIRRPLTSVRNPPAAVAWLEEFLDGDDLTDRLGVPWDWGQVLRLGLDVARGLEVLHDRSVVHRDLSPNNIRCLAQGGHVIMDPGYARHLSRSTLTVFGQPGTPGFLSPEHLSQSGPMPASDIYCLGVLMFLALTGDLPHPLTADVAGYQVALRTQAAPQIAALRQDLTLDAASIVDRCLQTQPARRFLDGRALRVALEGLAR